MISERRILRSGELLKKNPGGFGGYRQWKKRYFILDEEGLFWYVTKEEFENGTPHKGVILPPNASKVQFCPEKRNGNRFNIHVRKEDGSTRIYALEANSVEIARDWCEVIYSTFLEIRSAMNQQISGKRILEDIPWIPSKLQLLFFNAKFGEDTMKGAVSDGQERDAILANIEHHFRTDAMVLRFILANYLDPAQGQFLYDLREDMKADEGAAPLPPNRMFASRAANARGRSSKVRQGSIVATRSRIAATPRHRMSTNTPEKGSWFSGSKPVLAILRWDQEEGGTTLNQELSQRMCMNRDCGTGSINGELFCREHQLPDRSAELDLASRGVLKCLRSADFVRVLVGTFRQDDKEVHSLSLVVLWIVLRKLGRVEGSEEFVSRVSIHAPEAIAGEAREARMSMSDLHRQVEAGEAKEESSNDEMKERGGKDGNATSFHGFAQMLVYLLTCDAAHIATSIDQKTTLSFQDKVVHHGIWPCLFIAVKETSFELRNQSLSDANTLLLNNYENCVGLTQRDDWGVWVLELLTDLPVNYRENRVTKDCFMLTINIMVAVLVSYFFKAESGFKDMLEKVLEQFYKFGGCNNASSHLASIILGALASKIAAEAASFPSQVEGPIWSNFTDLTAVFMKFLLRSTWWQTHKGPKENGQNEKLRNDSRKLRQRLESSGSNRNLACLSHRSTSSFRLSDNHIPPSPSEDIAPHPSLRNNRRRLSNTPPSQSEYLTPRNSGGPGMKISGDSYGSLEYNVGGASLDSDEEPPETVRMILYKNPGNLDRHWNSPPDITDFGLHWKLDGTGQDTELIQKVIKLYKKLRIEKFDPELDPSMEKEEKDARQAQQQEYLWWEDAARFLALVRLDDLAKFKICSFRKFSYMCQTFFKSTCTADRLGVMKEIKLMQANVMPKNNKAALPAFAEAQ